MGKVLLLTSPLPEAESQAFIAQTHCLRLSADGVILISTVAGCGIKPRRHIVVGTVFRAGYMRNTDVKMAHPKFIFQCVSGLMHPFSLLQAWWE